MGFLFGGPPQISSSQASATPPPPPTPMDPPVQQGADQLLASQATARGRASTIATSGQGVLTKPTVARKTLLGE